MTRSFIRDRRDDIVREWETAARGAGSATVAEDAAALRGRLPELLAALSTWVEGDAASLTDPLRAAVARHVALRLDARCGLAGLVAELGLLRRTIARLLRAAEAADGAGPAATDPARARVEDGLEQTLAAVVEQFVAERDRRLERALERSEVALRHAGAMAHLGAWWFEWAGEGDPALVRPVWSDETYRIFGYEPGEVEVTGKLFLDHVPADDRPGISRAMTRALVAGRPYVVEHRIVRRDGAERIVVEHADVRRSGDGARASVVGAVQDVTEQRQVERALREADRRKTEFLATLSHELRNPLAPIRSSIDLLDRAPPDGELARRAREVIRRQSAHLARLVDDLLDATRIARGKIHLQRAVHDARALLRRVCEDHASLVEQGGLALRVALPAAPVWVDVDAERAAQVAGNLLQNAIKFTPAGGAVTVSVRAVDGVAELAVGDTGIGIDPACIGRMFEAFAQEERGRSRTRGGIGLGLALAKGLVELHGGTIHARSDGLGRGSEFLVRFPLARPPGRRRQPPAPRAEASPAPLRILVIEDNADAAQTLADLLRLEGHEVRLARTGESGLALARALGPDLVLCDIGLPDVDGYAVARALRQDPALAATRLVALSGFAQPEDRQRALAAGFDAHLPKPTPLPELERILGAGPRGDGA